MEAAELPTPTATQVLEVAQDTLPREFKPEGATCGSQLRPLLVPTISDPPTAVHSSIVKQEIDCAGNDESCTVQLAPPLLDLKIPELPPA